jgi:hypothetical protein
MITHVGKKKQQWHMVWMPEKKEHLIKEVADRTGRLLAGNISNTTIFNRHDPNTIDEARSIFKVNSLMKYY